MLGELHFARRSCVPLVIRFPIPSAALSTSIESQQDVLQLLCNDIQPNIRLARRKDSDKFFDLHEVHSKNKTPFKGMIYLF